MAFLDNAGLAHFKEKMLGVIRTPFKAATASAAGAVGAVPAPPAGAQGKFLNGAGQWVTINVPAAVPSGVMVPFAGKTVPDGWLLCNGASLAKASYPDLFTAIGYTWGGSGDRFYLPNYNGRHILGTTYANNVGSTVSAGLPDIRGYATSGIIWTSVWMSYGALWTEDSKKGSKSYSREGTDPIVNVRMRAGAYDSTYGRSSSVSVPAAQALIIIKL